MDFAVNLGMEVVEEVGAKISEPTVCKNASVINVIAEVAAISISSEKAFPVFAVKIGRTSFPGI